MSRRNFTRNQKEQIVERSKVDGVIRCERCGLALKKGQYEIDHIIAEGLRPEADKKKPITIAEGQLLGKNCCHRGEDGKTNQDVKAIAKAKRQYDRDNGLKQPAGNIPNRGFAKPAKPKQSSRWDFLPPLEPKTIYRKETT